MPAGVIYFVTRKKKFLAMAKFSAQSLKKYMPHLKTTLFTDLDLDKFDYFNDIIHTETPKQTWLYKWKECLMKSPYNPTLYLDADTYICDDFSEVFDMMNRFDLVGLMSPHQISDQKIKDVPICFTELCGGFLLWKQSKKIDWLFKRTIELVKNKSWGRGDEPSMRKALYESKVRYALIPWEYTCVFRLPGYLFGKVKIMHGESSDIVANAKIFNQNTERRVYTGKTLILTRKTDKKHVEIDQEIQYL